MYISKLKIKNFKCFDVVEIEFDPNFNLIIGENNSGKSTIFEALRLWQLAIQQFYTARTFKKSSGNIGFYRKFVLEPLLINDLSFLRIEDLNEVLYKRINSSIVARHFEIEEENRTFIIELTFSNDATEVSIPIQFKPNSRNTLNCKIHAIGESDLKRISNSLSEVMEIAPNDTFRNRIRLAYIPPKFNLPNKEILLSERNSYISEKLIMGESQKVIRNIIHNWAELEYQKSTKKRLDKTIKESKRLLNEIINDADEFEIKFNDNIKPYIENVLGYSLLAKRIDKSSHLIQIEEGLSKILNQNFNFKSFNNPLYRYNLQIRNVNDNSEISQLGSGTINVLNILSVIKYNEQTIDKASTKCNLLLLDEPDSHLHSNLQFKLFEYLFSQTADSIKQFFIISHNSGLISQFERVLFIQKNKRVIEPILIDDYLENHLKNIDENHYRVIKELNEAKKEKEAVEKQLIKIRNLDTPIVYTEGPSDVIILENAFKKLYPEESIKFQIVNGYSCTQLKNTFENKKTFEKNNNPQIAIFDFDTAYSQWNGLWNGKEKKFIDIEQDPFKALSKKHSDFNAYATLLPIPKIDIIKNQVLDPDNSNINFGDNSILQIEHLFFDVVSLKESFDIKNIVAGGKCVYFKGDKLIFAEKTKNLSKEDFKHFIPLFEKIAEIINLELPKL